MDDGHWSMYSLHGAQKRQGDRVVSPQGDELAARLDQIRSGSINGVHGTFEIEGIAGDIAHIHHLLIVEWLGIHMWVISPQ